MKEITGDIWDYHEQGYTVCVTTNGVVKKNGECVMGAGVAFQAKQRFPKLPQELGRRIQHLVGNRCYYFKDYNIITFPTKHNWWESSDIELIKEGCIWLMVFLDSNTAGVDRVYLPKPGCSNGKLEWDYVKSEIESLLDDRVWIIDLK